MMDEAQLRQLLAALQELSGAIETGVEQAVSRERLHTVLDLLESDNHSYGDRPCSTCASVSFLAGRPFGCTKRQKK